MTTESDYTQRFQAELKRRRYKVFKHADKFTKGVPDTSASRNHKTVWFEFKRWIVRSGPHKKFELKEFGWWAVIGKEDMVQLANMVDLERDALAFYVLFVSKGSEYKAYVTLPNQVLYSVKKEKMIPLGEPFTIEEMREWI